MWQSWSTCSVLCGKEGFRIRKRYCTNPLPQFGGKDCYGKDNERGPCEELKPCPIHCAWSQWGAWGACSITCGFVGEGVMARGRHIAVEANYGGRTCSGNKMEMMTCYHVDMAVVKKNNIKNAINFCPSDCYYEQLFL